MSDITDTDAGPSPEDSANSSAETLDKTPKRKASRRRAEAADEASAPPDEAASWSPATDAMQAGEIEEPKATGRKATAKRAKTAAPEAEEAPAKAAPKRKANARPEAAEEPAASEASEEPTATRDADLVPVEDAASVEEPDTDEVIDSETAPESFEGERIAKAIARAGIASRRDAEAMILEGRVTLNGKRLDSPAVNVTEADRIAIDGEPLPARERTRLWVFHKPRGLVTTARDPEGRPTVFESLPDDLPRVVAVGRLDINTEGLLLLTNDGGLAKVIAHPDTGWLRRYRVRAWGDTTQAELDRLRKGVTIDGMEYGPIEANLDRVQGDNLWITLGLREGKNREVKRILEHLGLSVNRLIRLSFGPFQLGELEVGLVEEVRTKVLKEQLGRSLSEQAGVDFESAVREPVAPFGSPKATKASGETGPSARGRREAPAGAQRGAPRGGSFGAKPALAKPARVPTGGAGPGPRRSVWRASDETEAQAGFVRPSKPPRRGADPKAERAAAAERARERVGAIKTGERRVVIERLKATPVEPVVEPHRRTRFRKAGDDAPRQGGARRYDDRPERGAYAERPQRSDTRPPRRDDDGRSDSRPPRSRDDRSGGFGEGRGGERRSGERYSGERAEGGRPAAKPFRPASRSFGGGEASARGGDQPRGRAQAADRPRSARPEGGRPDGERGGFGRSGASRDGAGYKGGAGKPGGFKAGGARGSDKGAGFKGAGATGAGAKGGYKGARDQGDRPRSGGGGRPGSGGAPGRSGPGGGRSGGGRPPRAGR